jgi:hypothetical protein
MSKLIAQLLNADQRNLSKTILRLESMCLHPGVDTKLTAEIITQAREKARRLGFDPIDATREELYYGLLAKAQADDVSLRNCLQISIETTTAEATRVLALQTEKLLSKDIVICMHPATLKKILKAVPPKRTLRALQFRSIEAVLKREDPLVLYALATRLEDSSWHTQVQARMKRLQPRDAKECHIKVLCLPEAWIQKLYKKQFSSVIQPVPEIGCILILPTIPLSVPGAILLTVCLALQAGQRLAVEALPHRSRALSVGYEKLLPDVASGKIHAIKPVYGLQATWQAVFQLLAERGRDKHSDFDFILSDLEWQSTETRLASISPELDFWVNSHYLGYSTEIQPLSFHVVDVTASLVLNKKYGKHVISHLQASLWNELQLRYLKQENIERLIISQLTMAQEAIL